MVFQPEACKTKAVFAGNNSLVFSIDKRGPSCPIRSVPSWSRRFQLLEMPEKEKPSSLAKMDLLAFNLSIRLNMRQGERLLEICNIVPPKMRYYFLENGLKRMMQNRWNFEPDGALGVLQMVAGNMSGPKAILPQETLKFFSHGESGYCDYSMKLFGNARSSGTLVGAKAPINGIMLDVLIKGFFSNSGNVIAVDRRDFLEGRRSADMGDLMAMCPLPFYNMEMRDGSITKLSVAYPLNSMD